VNASFRFCQEIDPNTLKPGKIQTNNSHRCPSQSQLSAVFHGRLRRLTQEKGPACAGPSLFLGRKHPTEDVMNVPQAVRLVVAEMSHCPRKAAAENTLAVSEYSRKSGNPLIKAKVMARKSVLPGCIKKRGDRECGSLTSSLSD
jgi:hypothetical protein